MYSVIKDQGLEFAREPLFQPHAAYKGSDPDLEATLSNRVAGNFRNLVEMIGVEPATPWLQTRCSAN
jgi:hypothetical protein